MHFIAKVSVALFALTAFAYAADDPFADLYANTLVFTTAKNVVIKVLANKDGTWTSTSSDKKNPTGSGMWATIGSWVCVTDAAMPTSKPACQKSVAHAIGDKWTQTEPDKTVTQITLTAGR